MSQVLFGSGDVLAQQAVDRRGFGKHDMARPGRMALYGGGRSIHFSLHGKAYPLTDTAIFGPAATTWFGVLQRHVVLNSKATTIAARVAADQCVFTPTHLTCFLSSMAIMEGSDPIEKLRTAFIPSYKANLTLWPLVQGINFTFVPLEYRVLFVNLISLGECNWH